MDNVSLQDRAKEGLQVTTKQACTKPHHSTINYKCMKPRNDFNSIEKNMDFVCRNRSYKLGSTLKEFKDNGN